MKCSLCEKDYTKKPKDSSTLTKCSSCVTTGRRRKKKIRCIEYKGGKCERCGYDRCVGALVFHHKDPSQKKFEIGPNIDTKWSELTKELDKCALLCSNCHSEVHEEINDALFV